MATIDKGIYYPHTALRDWSRQILLKVGVSETDVDILNDSLVAASLRGVDSHGITRMLSVYVKRIQVGVMNSDTKIEVVRQRPSTALFDCHNSIGQLGAHQAMQTAIKKAKNTGIAFAAVTHSNHYGAAAYWAMMALEHGMIGFSAVNAPAAVAPTGGRRPMFGTNPFAVAIPAGNDVPFVLDLATTVVARGRIVLYAKQGKALEQGWAFDELGRPTTDADKALKGLLAPIGGYKGYGISFAIDVLSGILTGSNFGKHFPGMLAENMERPWDAGGVFMAVDIDSFMDLQEFNQRMETAFKEVRSCDKAEGVERIYTPGELEHLTRLERLQKGIPLPVEIVEEFTRLGEELSTPFPKP